MISRTSFGRVWAIAFLMCISSLLLAVDSSESTVLAEGNAQTAPSPNTPIEHFIFLMQENHSFDNYFGTYPGANGLPPDTCIPVDPFNPANTECVKPFHASEAPNVQPEDPVQPDDPDHSTETFLLQYNEGKMNGFVYALNERNQDGRLAMLYYDDRELPYYWNIADQYVLFDNYFTSAGGGSFINHLYWIAGTHDVPPAGQNLQEYLAGVPTIFDKLTESGISWKFYIQNYEPALTYRTRDQYPGNRQSQVTWVPLLSIDRFIDDPVLSSKLVDLDEYYTDLTSGTLPNVAFMVPSGPSEHPPSSLLSGQRFVRVLLQSLMQSKYWERSAFMWTYDDWGGWYDHVPPPQVDAYGFGPRAPALLVSAYAKRGHIDSTLLDFTSGLKFIQENWGLDALSVRDAAANNFLSAFDFTQPPRPAELVPFERDEKAKKPEPNRTVIYVLYGAALLVSGLVVATAVIINRRGGIKISSKEKGKAQT
jgi:phospholipase C